MSELKRTFTSGKMNKDVDERLVPNGEYVDALNIQVKTTGASSDQGGVGTIQSVKGNVPINEDVEELLLQTDYVGSSGIKSTRVVGSVSNEKDNNCYFFIGGPQFSLNKGDINVNAIKQQGKKCFYDVIMEVNVGVGTSLPTINPVIVDKYAVVDTFANWSPMPLNGDWNSPYAELELSSTSDLSIGMVAYAFNSSGIPMWQGAEIQKIEDKTIYLYTPQNNNALLNECEVIAFVRQPVLSFHKIPYDRNITGINIIDDIMLWTDDITEPKKINIRKCKAGCATGTNKWTTHTKMFVSNPKDKDNLIPVRSLERTFNNTTLTPTYDGLLREEDITVKHKAPTYAPTITLKRSPREKQTEVNNIPINFTVGGSDSGNYVPGDTVIISDPTLADADFRVNDILVISGELDVEQVVKISVDSVSDDETSISGTIISITAAIPAPISTVSGSGEWTIELESKRPIFELKFGRFAYRYNYEDNEYSSFSPWSELAFLPSRFDYNHRKGYNLGMVNDVREVIIENFIPHQRVRPRGVKAIDILYKSTDNANCYVVKTITRGKDQEWDLFVPSNSNPNMMFGKLVITSEMIHKALPANQLLRGFDAVPRYALAQEIVGNRLVYGNYTQGYDIEGTPRLLQSLVSKNEATLSKPKKSIKSLRTYKFGMVFGDKYGRETTVISPGYLSGSNYEDYTPVLGGDKVDKIFAPQVNQFSMQQRWDGPTTTSATPDQWIDYVKYYVKETSNEYYTLAMDRWYDAEDGNIWISFVSADRNKLDEETYLVLKNEHGSNTPVVEKARYKIISISADAPDFIKIDQRDMGMVSLGSNEYGYMFTDTSPDVNVNTPDKLKNEKEIVVSTGMWGGFLADHVLGRNGTLLVRVAARCAFNDVTLSGNTWQKVSYINTAKNDLGEYQEGTVRWKDEFLESADMQARFTEAGYTNLDLTYKLEFREDVVENKSEYDGKFFVKIERDGVLQNRVLKFSGLSTSYDAIWGFPLVYIDTRKTNPGEFGSSQPVNRSSYRWNETSAVPPSGTPGNYDVLPGNSSPMYDYASVHAFALGCGGSDQADIDGYFVHNRGGDDTREYWRWFKDVVGSTSVGLKDHTRLFVDSCRARDFNYEGNPDGNMIDDGDMERSRFYYKPTGWDEGYLNYGSDEVLPTQDGELGRVAISTPSHAWGANAWIGDELAFKNIMSTKGTLFKFVDDPNGEIYEIVSNSDDIQEWKTGHVHNYSIKSDCQGQLCQECLSTINFNFVPGINAPGDDINCGWDGNNNNCYDVITNFQPDYNVQTGLSSSDANTTAAGGSVDGSCTGNIGNSDLSGMAVCPNCNFDYSGIGGPNPWPDDKCERMGFRVEFRRLDSNGQVIPDRGIDTSIYDPRSMVCHDGRESFNVQILKRVDKTSGVVLPLANAAVWETEPKEDVGLDIYYEASNAIPMRLTSENSLDFIPYNCRFSVKTSDGEGGYVNKYITGQDHHVYTVGYNANETIVGLKSTKQDVVDWHDTEIGVGDFLVFHHPDGTETMSKVVEYAEPMTWLSSYDTSGAAPNFSEVLYTNTETTNGVNAGIGIQFSGFQDSSGYNQYVVVQNPQSVVLGASLIGEGIPEGTYIQNVYGTTSTAVWITIDGPGGDYMFDQTPPYDLHKIGTYKGGGWYKLDSEVWKYPVKLPWFNCYTWGNGVESDRIRDDFNAPTIDNGVKVSTTFLDYGEEKKGSGMIYSGLFNSISGVNDLNEFNTGEKIQKDLNPSYGSIQRLKTRDTDLVTFCEDKILKVTANKDAVYNADGDPRLIATNRVLGTAGAFAGDYGISKNPESLAWDQYRMYFTDKERGAVLRLSQDGLTPISSVGMKSWFRDNLKENDHILGTFDDVNGEYNVSLRQTGKTVSFNEESKGWVSFKSFVPQAGQSVTGQYITAKGAGAWKHYVGSAGRFYGNGGSTEVSFVFNEMPGTNKTFQTLSYEGTKQSISSWATQQAEGISPNGDLYTASYQDGEHYNLTAQAGWMVSSFFTNLETASVKYFIEKEGKFHGGIHGVTVQGSNTEVKPEAGYSDFSVQGIGVVSDVSLLPQYDLPTTIDGELIIVDDSSSSSTNVNVTITVDGEDNDDD